VFIRGVIMNLTITQGSVVAKAGWGCGGGEWGAKCVRDIATVSGGVKQLPAKSRHMQRRNISIPLDIAGHED